MRRTVRWATWAVLAVMFVSACGNSGGEVDEATEAAAEVTEPTAIAAPTESPTSTAVPTSPPVEPARALASVLDTAPGPNGWHLPAGRWTTTAFIKPITFTTTVDLTLISEADAAVYLANPAQPESKNLLVLATAAFVNSGGPGSPEIPVPKDPDGITALLESGPVTDLVGMGTVSRNDRAVPWWEVVLRETPIPGSGPCTLGDQCLTIAVSTGGEPVSALVDERLRIFEAGFDDTRIGVYVVGEADGYESLVEITDDVVSSLEIASSTLDSDRSFLRSLGTRQPSIPSGQYLAHLQSSIISFDIAEEIDTLGRQGGGTATAMFGNPNGLVTFLELAEFVDPAANQAGFENHVPLRSDYLANGPSTPEAFGVWLSELVSVIDTGEATIGGVTAQWWDFSLDTTAASVPCTFAPAVGGECVTIMLAEPFVWFAAETFDNRIYFFEEQRIALYIEAFPGGTVEELLLEAEPLLDSLTFIPIE